MKKIVRYSKIGGGFFQVAYDPKTPCISCGLPVEAASMGGTAVCPACDCGKYRNGEEWTYDETVNAEKRKAKAKRVWEELTTPKVKDGE